MMSSLKAALCYSTVSFSFAFLFATVRVLILQRFLSDLVAALIWLPFVLVAAWRVCQSCVRYWHIQAKATRRSMGLISFFLLQVIEVSVGYVLMKKPVGEYFHQMIFTSAGFFTLLGQIVFGCLPTLIPITHVESRQKLMKLKV
jgi:hypothetical protein